MNTYHRIVADTAGWSAWDGSSPQESNQQSEQHGDRSHTRYGDYHDHGISRRQILPREFINPPESQQRSKHESGAENRQSFVIKGLHVRQSATFAVR